MMGALVAERSDINHLDEVVLDRKKPIIDNRIFTIEDMRLCYNTAKRRAIMQEAGLEADLGFEDYIKNCHEDKTEWLVEINSDNKIATK